MMRRPFIASIITECLPLPVSLSGETLMRVAALNDIHSNLPALEAVLQDVRQAGVDQIVVGGDVVLGPMPRESLDALFSLDIPIQFIQGNCEREFLNEVAGR